MTYAQISAGQKLHLVYEPGEGYGDFVQRAPSLSLPLCGRRTDRYRMAISLPLANACKNCLRVYSRRHAVVRP